MTLVDTGCHAAVGAVPVELDAVLVGIAQVQGLADASGLRDPLAILKDTGGSGLPILRDAQDDPVDENTVATVLFRIEPGLVGWEIHDRPDASDAALLVPHDTSFLSNSMTVFTLCAECLINACAARLGEKAAAALADRDALITRLKIEI